MAITTEQLYYTDPYMREFTTSIVAVRHTEDAEWVALASTAFYPEGGGQPADQGMIYGSYGQWHVKDVQATADGLIWHCLADLPPADGGQSRQPQVGEQIRGCLNWNRRFDHMQQHCGQHILSQAFICVSDTETVSFHLGEEYSSIDLDVADLTPIQVDAAEALANREVNAAEPIRVVWVDAAGAKEFNLRKAIDRETNIRIVAIGDFDHSGCGGTHPANTAEVGLIKVLGWEKNRGRVRLSFLCGNRAIRDYKARIAVTQQVAAALGTNWSKAVEGIRMMQTQLATVTERLQSVSEQAAKLQAENLLQHAQQIGSSRLVLFAASPADGPGDLRILAQQIVTAAGDSPVVALLCTSGDKPHIIFVRNGVQGDAGPSMVDLLRPLIANIGGRGGGTSLMAQGGVPSTEAASALMGAAMAQLQASLSMQEGW